MSCTRKEKRERESHCYRVQETLVCLSIGEATVTSTIKAQTHLCVPWPLLISPKQLFLKPQAKHHTAKDNPEHTLGTTVS